jgi:hypothetical protein
MPEIVSMLVYVLVILLLVSLAYWAVLRLPLPEPARNIAIVVIGVIAVIAIIYLIVGLIPTTAPRRLP